MHKTQATLMLATLAYVFAALPSRAQTATPPAAKAAKAAPSGAPAGLSDLGNIDLDADSSNLGQGYVVYHHAHMTAQNGTKLDADDLRANLAQGSNAIETVVATGNVKAYLNQPDLHRTYTVTADKAVYDLATQLINLTGNVKTVLVSTYTSGPLVQTGDSGVIKLGPAPDYPQITMNHVHTTFTPQRPAASPSALRAPSL